MTETRAILRALVDTGGNESLGAVKDGEIL